MPKVRKFLIKRIEEFFQTDEIKDINAFLKQYYLTKSDNATTPYRQKESLYLSYYHGIQENPDEGFRMIFNEFLNHTDTAIQLPMIDSLINICNLPPRRANKNPYYTYLKHQACFLKDGENKKEIKNSFGELFKISKLLSSGKDRNLKLQILNLLLKLNEVLPSKKIKKNNKKILKLDDQVFMTG